jgi:acetyl esterase/lipase
MSQIRVVLSSLLLAGSAVGTACGQSSPARDTLPIVSTPGVWQPGPGGTQMPLWPDSVVLARPDSGDRAEETGNGSARVAGRAWHWAGNVTRPTMTLYRPKGRKTGATMLVLPGGGFSVVAMDLEGSEICDWAVRRGMTCAVLKYRTPQAWPEIPGTDYYRRPDTLLALEDAQRAIGLLRQHAAEYGIDPARIGVIGFSAGAYLATEMSNTEARSYPPIDAADRLSARPDFAIITYTARLLKPGSAGPDLTLAPWVRISAKAPPTLLIHAMDDPMDDVRHPMAYALALHAAGVPVDLRFYAKGGHAFGMRPSKDPITTEWPGQAEQWLRTLGML